MTLHLNFMLNNEDSAQLENTIMLQPFPHATIVDFYSHNDYFPSDLNTNTENILIIQFISVIHLILLPPKHIHDVKKRQNSEAVLLEISLCIMLDKERQ